MAGYKVNIQNSKAFLYINSEKSETETSKKNSIYCTNKKNTLPNNKPKQGSKRPILIKLHNTEERN